MKIGIVYNPFAGKNKTKGGERIKNLESLLNGRGILRETRSIEEIDKAAQEFHHEQIDILGISGGDGTNNFVLSRFQKVYGEELPLLLLLKGGTMNLLESCLGMKGGPEDRLKRCIQQIDKNCLQTVPHTLLKVNDKMGYIFGNGIIANFMQEYYKGGDPGPKKALQVLMKACCSSVTGGNYYEKLFAPIGAHVQIGDTLLPQSRFMALMAATEKGCGLGFKPFYRARQAQGKLHFLAINLSPFELIKNLPRFRAGKKVKNDNLFETLTDKVVINTFHPYYYTLDGEMLNSTTRIELSPGPIVKIIAV